MKRIIVILLILSCITGAALAQDGERLTQQQINTIVQSVVQIVAPVGGDEYSLGSGTIVSSDGLIYTNRHVIEGGLDFFIFMLDDIREPAVHRYSASLVGVSDQLDFAVLKIDRDANGTPLNPATLNLPFIQTSEAQVEIGDRIQVFGFPTIGDGYMVVTSGEITTIQNGSVGQQRLPVWYQTDTQISPGNSGGLAVNLAGQMIGIPTMVKVEDRTGGRLGGILPIVTIDALNVSKPSTSTSIPEEASFTLINESNQTICYVFISPVTSTSWGEDQLGSDEVIQAGMSRTWNVQAGYYDLMLRDCNTDVMDDQRNLEILSASSYTYHGSSQAQAPSQGTGQAVPFTIMNQSNETICEVFISPVTSTTWGDNQLGNNEVIPPGTSLLWNIAPDYYDILLQNCTAEVLIDQRNVEILGPYTFTVGNISGSGSGSAGSGGGSSLAPVAPTTVTTGGLTVTCDNGVSFTNGVGVTIREMRTGFNYTVTAIGINGFDPVLTVFNDATGEGLCLDDADASQVTSFIAQLPTTGRVQGVLGASQLVFSQNSGRALADMTVIVGGYGDQAGEFILLIEGMAATPEDNAGDPISVYLTPGLIYYGVPLSVYMIAETGNLDPLMYLADDRLQPQVDSLGVQVVCDDAGTPQCWGQSAGLSSSGVSFARGILPGGDFDAMLSIPLDGFVPVLEDPEFLTFVFTSFNRQSTGRYIVAIHAGTQ